jgi:ubiquinone/menaquinone biosynthesis C-methylase UbiE
MDYRKIFDSKVSVDDFDRWRTRYCDALFADVIRASNLAPGKTALEIGPGTGQATEPIVKTGCSYMAIELGDNFAAAMKDKFARYDNVKIVHADFETYSFEDEAFDLVYSAATIQWIREDIAFSKAYSMMKHDGILAMFMTRTDYKSPDEDLYAKIQRVYDEYFKPTIPYTQKFVYENAVKYGFVDLECRRYPQTRVYTADEFIWWTIIQASHLTLKDADKENFVRGIREAISSAGGEITLLDDIVLYLARKP